MSVSYPNQYRNYCVFDETQPRKSIEQIKESLKNPNSEDEVIEDLYTLNCMLDNGEKGIEKLYPELSRYNQTDSPNIQTYLAGIYRKTKIPDAFGPLVTMLIQNSINPERFSTKPTYFDPNEEIGGAILNYLA